MDGLCKLSEDNISYSLFKGRSRGYKKNICTRSDSAGCRRYLEVSWSSKGLGVYIRVRIYSALTRCMEKLNWPVASSSNKMPAAVKSAIQDAIERYGGYSSEDAAEFIKKMVQEGRLIEECWS